MIECYLLGLWVTRQFTIQHSLSIGKIEKSVMKRDTGHDMDSYRSVSFDSLYFTFLKRRIRENRPKYTFDPHRLHQKEKMGWVRLFTSYTHYLHPIFSLFTLTPTQYTPLPNLPHSPLRSLPSLSSLPVSSALDFFSFPHRDGF